MADSILNLLLNIRKAGKGDKEAASGIDQMGKKIESVVQNSRKNAQVLNATVGAVGKMLGDAFKLAADEAERLGRSEVTAQMKEMNDSFKTVTDTLVQIPIGGRDFLAWMGDAAEGAANAGKAIAALSILISKNTGALTESQAATQAAILINGPAIVTTEQMAQAQKDLADPMDETNRLLSDQADAAKRAADEGLRKVAEAATAAAMKAGEFNAILGQAVDNELAAYQDKQRDIGSQIADTKLQLDELGKTPHLTQEQQGQLAELKTKYADLKQVYADNAEAHNLATRSIMLDFLRQQLAMDGPLTDAEMRFVLKVGEDWGVLKKGTAETWDAVSDNIETSMGDSEEFVKGMANRLPGYFTDLNFDLNYNVHVNGQVPDAGVNNTPGGSGNAYSGGGEVPQPIQGGFASGTEGWMTVPAGYPNDSYRIGLSSGEAFAVVPNNQTTTTNMGGITINVNGASDPRAVAQEVSRIIAAQARAYKQAGQR